MKTTIEETAAFSVQISGAVIPPLPQPKERIHRVKRHVGSFVVVLDLMIPSGAIGANAEVKKVTAQINLQGMEVNMWSNALFYFVSLLPPTTGFPPSDRLSFLFLFS